MTFWWTTPPHLAQKVSTGGEFARYLEDETWNMAWPAAALPPPQCQSSTAHRAQLMGMQRIRSSQLAQPWLAPPANSRKVTAADCIRKRTADGSQQLLEAFSLMQLNCRDTHTTTQYFFLHHTYGSLPYTLVHTLCTHTLQHTFQPSLIILELNYTWFQK